jgi:hypothetical protein
MGLFSDHVPMNREIKERSGVIYFLTSIGAIGRVNRFFFRLLGSRKHEEIEKKTQQILNVFNQFSPLQNYTKNIDQLLRDRFYLSVQAISLEKFNVFQFDFVKEFWFGKLSPEDPTRVYLHIAPDPGKAIQLYQSILQEQLFTFKKVGISELRTILKHKFLKTYFVMERQENRIF